MSYSDALLLTTSGDNWNSLTSGGVTPLGFTFYSTVNPYPDYYYTDAPTDTVWSSNYTDLVTPTSEDFVQTAQKNLIRHDLSDTSGIDYRVSFSDVSNLTYSEQNSPSAVGQIFIANANVTAANTFGETVYPESANGYSTFAGDVWLDNDPTADSYGFTQKTVMQSQLGISQMGAYVTLHELGHAVGLIHTSEAGLTGTIYDDQKYTIMTDNTLQTDSDMDASVFPTGLQLLDIAVLQSMYGVNWGGTRGEGGALENTVYGKEGAFATANAHDAFIYTIWDGAGTDVIDASGYSTPAEIDLRQGHFSSIGVKGDSGDTPVAFDSGGVDHGNLTIAYFAIIENAIGTGADDILIGNAWNNALYGGAGNDIIFGDGVTADGDAGFHDANTIADATSTVYSWGPDAIAPAADLSGNDILIGGAGNDYFGGGLGNDVIHGGYVASDIAGVVSGWDPAGEFTGTNNDAGAALSDISYSADGTDTVDYSQLPDGTSGDTGIDITFSSTGTVDLASVVKGHAGEYGTDTLFSIEAVRGTPWNDTFEGTGLEVSAYGSAGNDTYTFFATAPTIGGSGIDYSSLDSLSAHIAVVFSGSGGTIDKSNAGGSLGEDTLSVNVHSIVGTSGDDTFAGMIPGGDTDFIGGAGNDTYSFNMNDLLAAAPYYAVVTVTEDTNGSLNNVSISNYDSVTFDSYVMTGSTASIDYTYQAWNSGTSAYDYLFLTFARLDATGIDTVVYGSTTYEFGGNTYDTFTAASGVHLYDGGTGINTIDYSAATGGINVNLLTGIVSNNGWGYADTVHNISNVLGSSHDDSITGDANANTISGGAGNDVIAGGGGADVIDGGAGTDTIDYSAAAAGATVNLATGTASNDGDGSSDTLTTFENITGTAFNDNLTGDGNANVLNGGAGNDTIAGGAGNDTLIGGPGNDSLDGGSGTDTVDFSASSGTVIVYLATGSASGDGTDTLSNIENVTGSSHVDVLAGNSGDNILDGGAGSDWVTYDFSSSGVTVNLLTGTATGDGNDTLLNIENIIGSQYNDTLIGTAGSLLIGDQGNDTLEAGTAYYLNDIAGVTVNLSMGTATDGWGNTDTLINIHNVIGSSYNDTIIADSSADGLNGGTGIDTVSFAAAAAAVTVNLATTSAQNTVGAGTDTIINFENLTGSAFADTLTGDGNNNVIEGLAGNDTMNGGAGTDTVTYVDATAGITISLALGTAQVTGGAGTDTISLFENLTGSAFNDTLTGDLNANTIDGGAGNDVIQGGLGNDVLTGGAGIDTATYAAATAAVTVNLATLTAQNTVGAGTDTISGFENLTGSAFNDTLTGDGNNNVIEGLAGNDTMVGGAGIDTLTYIDATAAVTVNLATLTAQNTVGAGTDTISGFENLTGSAFNDTLTGDANANVIDGGAGNDVMNGAAGTDTLSYASATAGITISLAITTGQATGGSGTDTISNFENLTGSAYNDTLAGDANANTIDGGAGNDTLTYAAAASGVTVNLALTSAQVTGGAGTDTISNFENLTGSAFADTLTGDANANTISGGAGNDIIAGRGGADVLDGGTGTDTVDYSAAAAGVIVSLALGTASNDGDGSSDTLTNFENVTGSAFNDTIEGGAGNNTLVGGAGTDTVSYADATAGVTVNLATTTAQNTVGAGTDTITGFENLTGSAFADTLTGDGNNNVIEGLAGNDVMVGGLGTDTVTYVDAASAVTVSLATTAAQNTVGAGTDTISGFENLTGSAFNDTLTGDANANVLQGLAGNDLLSGGAGNDTLDGGTGTDTATFASAASAVTVDLHAGTATGDGTDTLISIENVTGSTHNDTIISNSSDNVLDGGTGTDTVSYAPAASHVTVDLSTGTATGDGNDTLSNFENVIGSAFDDTITGDTNVNTLTGGAGNDTITGGGGADLLYGGTGSDTFLFLAAHALTAIVKIEDFTTGSGNDKIDLKDVISGYDPATMAITDWVQITTSGSDSIVKVDIDGTGSAHTWQQIATIVGVTGLTDEAALVASGNLVVH